MFVSRPEISETDGTLSYRVTVRTTGGERDLWYKVDSAHAGFVSDSSDAALVGLLIPAMAEGNPLHLEGSVSPVLLYNLGWPLQSLLKMLYPKLKVIPVTAEKAADPEVRHKRGVATGFSGGVDSFALLGDYHFGEAPDALRVTHLLFNNVGAHGGGRAGERLFRIRLERVRKIANLLELPLVDVNSNLDQFYGEGEFPLNHTLRNASVASLLQRGINRFLYASGYKFADIKIRTHDAIAYVEVAVLPLLSTPSLTMVSSGGEYSRVEKTLKVAEIPLSHKHLEVCVNAGHNGEPPNCGGCCKCVRTLFTLELAGLIDRYAEAFDLQAYERGKKQFQKELLTSFDTYMLEIKELAQSRNYRFPSDIRRYAIRKRLAGYIATALAKIRKLAG